jgi:hypothetical protein
MTWGLSERVQWEHHYASYMEVREGLVWASASLGPAGSSYWVCPDEGGHPVCVKVAQKVSRRWVPCPPFSMADPYTSTGFHTLAGRQHLVLSRSTIVSYSPGWVLRRLSDGRREEFASWRAMVDSVLSGDWTL